MIASFNILDAVIFAIVFLSVVLGFVKGIVRELFSLGFLIIALVFAFLFYADARHYLFSAHRDSDGAFFLSFIMIFTLTTIAGSIVSLMIKKVFVTEPLQSIDRFLGGIVGFIRGVLVSGMVVYLMIVFAVGIRWLRQSRFSHPALRSFEVLMEVFPEQLTKKIDVMRDHDKQKNSRNSRTV